MTTPVQGFGLQPAGISANGLGAPADWPVPGQTYSAIAGLVAAKAIDPMAHDYITAPLLPGYPLVGVDPIAQRVLLALSTKLGQLGFSPVTGNDFLNLRVDNGALQKTALRAAQVALADIIKSGAIQIVSVQATRDGGAALEAVTWINTASGLPQTTPVPR